MPAIETTPELVRSVYATLEKNLAIVRKRLGRPLTYAEKVLFGHLADAEKQPARGRRRVSRAAARSRRDAGRDGADGDPPVHLVGPRRDGGADDGALRSPDPGAPGRRGRHEDRAASRTARSTTSCAAASARYGIGFWEPGAGIIHQVVLEKYAFPGGMMIGTDSHTPNAGGLGMFACGVGGADAVDVMAGFPWEVLQPKLVGVRLTGKLNGWTAPKDVILQGLRDPHRRRAARTAWSSTSGRARARSRAPARARSRTWAPSSARRPRSFPYDERMARLPARRRAARSSRISRTSKRRCSARIPRSRRSPRSSSTAIDRDRPLDARAAHRRPAHARPRAARLADGGRRQGEGLPGEALLVSDRQLHELVVRGHLARRRRGAPGDEARRPKAKTTLWVTPGSEQIHQTIERDGQLDELAAIGGVVLANACGPCIGQWKRDDVEQGVANSILTSFNRNFPERNDGNAETLAFIGSPEIVIAYALAGRLDFEPAAPTTSKGPAASASSSTPPAPRPSCPSAASSRAARATSRRRRTRSSVKVEIAPDSERLAFLAPFPAWDGKDFTELPILMKAKGKCTTDHISPAGPWLRFRGHLDKHQRQPVHRRDQRLHRQDGRRQERAQRRDGRRLSEDRARLQGARALVGRRSATRTTARARRASTPRWSRASSAACAVIVRSFARIHETNLKKQGLLPLTFANPADYDKVAGERPREHPRPRAARAGQGPEGRRCTTRTGSATRSPCKHTFNAEQIAWFKAGSALNVLRK